MLKSSITISQDKGTWCLTINGNKKAIQDIMAINTQLFYNNNQITKDCF